MEYDVQDLSALFDSELDVLVDDLSEDNEDDWVDQVSLNRNVIEYDKDDADWEKIHTFSNLILSLTDPAKDDEDCDSNEKIKISSNEKKATLHEISKITLDLTATQQLTNEDREEVFQILTAMIEAVEQSAPIFKLPPKVSLKPVECEINLPELIDDKEEPDEQIMDQTTALFPSLDNLSQFLEFEIAHRQQLEHTMKIQQEKEAEDHEEQLRKTIELDRAERAARKARRLMQARQALEEASAVRNDFI
jgi:hypothetical protein